MGVVGSRLVILVRIAVEHLQRTDDVCRFEQVPASIGLLRAGANCHRVHMVLRQVELLEGTEHVYENTVSKIVQMEGVESGGVVTYLRR